MHTIIEHYGDVLITLGGVVTGFLTFGTVYALYQRYGQLLIEALLYK